MIELNDRRLFSFGCCPLFFHSCHCKWNLISSSQGSFGSTTTNMIEAMTETRFLLAVITCFFTDAIINEPWSRVVEGSLVAQQLIWLRHWQWLISLGCYHLFFHWCHCKLTLCLNWQGSLYIETTNRNEAVTVAILFGLLSLTLSLMPL
jgi:hypothetical protein